MNEKIIVKINDKLKDIEKFNIERRNKYVESQKGRFKSFKKIFVDINNNYELNNKIIHLLFFYSEQVAYDIGRQWAKKNEIKKWDKNDHDCDKTY